MTADYLHNGLFRSCVTFRAVFRRRTKQWMTIIGVTLYLLNGNTLFMAFQFQFRTALLSDYDSSLCNLPLPEIATRDREPICINKMRK